MRPPRFLFLVEYTLLTVTNFKLFAIYMHDAININQRLSLEVAIHVCFIPPMHILSYFPSRVSDASFPLVLRSPPSPDIGMFLVTILASQRF